MKNKVKRLIGILPAILLLLVTVYKCANKDYWDDESSFDKESVMKKGYTEDEFCTHSTQSINRTISKTP